MIFLLSVTSKAPLIFCFLFLFVEAGLSQGVFVPFQQRKVNGDVFFSADGSCQNQRLIKTPVAQSFDMQGNRHHQRIML